MSKLSKKQLQFKRFAVVIGILIIPLMYSYFYLKAFWDPYSQLESLPVAVVNKDSGATINNEERNIGQEVQNKMKDSKDLGFQFVDENTASDGLNDGKYYAVIVIPNDFSEKISSSSTTNKEQAELIYSPNEKTNYLATQILNRAILELDDQVKENVTGEVVNTLTDKLNEVPSDLQELNDGVNKLYTGSSTITTGLNTLQDGTNSLNTNYKEFNSSLGTLKEGTTKLEKGSTDLNTGLKSAVSGAKELNEKTKDLSQINSGIEQLATGSSNLSTGIDSYVTGTDSFVTGTDAYINAVNQIINNCDEAGKGIACIREAMNQTSNTQTISVNELGSQLTTNGNNLKSTNQDVKSMQTGAKTINAQLNYLDTKTKDLYKINAGIGSLQSGLETMQTKVSTELVPGTESLDNGVSKLQNASSQVLTGISSIDAGTTKLANGSVELTNGLKKANSEVSDSITETNTELTKLDGLADYAKDPVVVDQESVNEVPNYGTAFAPYFMSLSLWVGGLIIFVGIYLDADEKFKILSRHSDKKILRTIIYFLIAIAQAILLAMVVQNNLHLTIEHPTEYYFACILVSIVFTSIIQFFMINFKDAGKFITILLLILQLTSCGGTFPMELVPSFFNKLYPFMPMTYSVSLFKEAISGGNNLIAQNSTLVLLGIFIAFATLTVLFALYRKKNEELDEITN